MKHLRKAIASLACSLLISLPIHSVNSATLNISDIPLFLGGVVNPNIMLTLDDSGSMHWENMPDDTWTYFVFPRASGVYGGSDYGNYVPDFDTSSNVYGMRVRSNDINKIYYNPQTTYLPWPEADGSLMADADPNAAYHNPFNTSAGTRDLDSNNTENATWERYDGDGSTFPGGVTSSTSSKTFYPAVYYQYDGSGDKWDKSSYTKVEIKSSTPTYSGRPNRTDCAAAPDCTYAEEIQNFANWYTYYRSRILLSRAGMGRAFSQQGDAMRVGFAAINKGSDTIDGVSSPGALVLGVREFTGADRTDFFSKLYDHTIPTSGTPLRRALDDVGQYFERTDNRGPYGKIPGTNDTSSHLTCRQNYNILMTDGYWNSDAASTTAATANVDNSDGPAITGPNSASYKYTPTHPYKDDWSNTLADVGMYYWNRDLRPNLDNKVPTNPADPAFWQHLVNFTVGLGVTGTLDHTDPQVFVDLSDGTTSWPEAVSDGGEVNIDDLWHTAINSRGEFFSAADPDTFAEAISDTLRGIASRTSSASSIATNSTRLDSDTFVYQARFDSTDWHGELKALKVSQSDGSILVNSPDNWEAGTILTNRSASRKIYTYDTGSSSGKIFSWSALSGLHHQSDLINGSTVTNIGENRLNYLRGARGLEIGNPGGIFRSRSNILGDIINSDPWFVGNENFDYHLLPGTEGSSYLTYRNSSAYTSRPGVVYVGANDGMLHAFYADNDSNAGTELFAYVPENIMPHLWELTDPNYNHRYYVDGSPKAADAYINSAWKTVLLGSTGTGGKSVFALDITDPVNFDQTDVMWEFADTTDLGYTMSQPSLVRLDNGDWGAVFGNGYNSADGKAILFIVDVETGSLIKKIDTETGSTSTPNGLSTPIVVDTNKDKIADTVYAGDLLGNMWAFDISGSNTNNWDVAYKQGSTPKPLFTATDGTNPQPITAKPSVSRHPEGGNMVFFGTGKYFEVGDTSDTQIQTFYGIRDNGAEISGRSSLVMQDITHEISETFTTPGNGTATWDLRVTTDNTVDYSVKEGWYLDLVQPSNSAQGERSVSSSILRENRIVFSTLIPDPDPCNFGGTGWLMELSSIDGARLSVSPFDLNNDGTFSSQDYVTVTVPINGTPTVVTIPVSGKKSKVGIIKTPGIVKTSDKEFKYVSGSTGDIETTMESRSAKPGRQSWRQLR